MNGDARDLGGKRRAWFVAALVLGIFLVYQPAWRASFIWDDDAHLTAHKCIVGPLGFGEIWTTAEANYFPLVLTTFWVVNKICGLNPTVFHLLGIALHAACAVTLWALLRRLRVPGAWLGATLWAFHPVQVESVAWVSEIINTQSGLFFLLSIYWAVRWLEAAPGSPGAKRSYGWALACAVGALTSKPSTVGLPVAIAFCAWWLRGRVTRREVFGLAPFFLLALGVSAWTVWEQKHHSGAIGEEWNQTFPERLAIAGRVIWFYLGKLAWPEPLVFIYPRWVITPLTALSFVPLGAALACFGGLVWSHRSRELRGVLFAAGFYGAMLFPVMGFFSVYFFRYSFVADHFQYLASMAPVVLIAACADRLVHSVRAHGPRIAFSAAGGLCLIAFSVLATLHARTFRNPEALWTSTLHGNPTTFLAWNNLGVSALEGSHYAEAEKYFRQVLELEPKAAEARFNLGKSLAGQGKSAEAFQEYEAAVRLNPALEAAHLNIANMLAGTAGGAEQAVAHYQRVLEINPNNTDAHSNLSTLLGGWPARLSEAIAHAETAVRLKPASAVTHLNLGLLLAKLPERRAEAITRFEEAIRLKPDYVKAHINLGLVLVALPGQRDRAIAAYEAALRYDPNSAIAHNNLAVALAQAERWREAREHFEKAVALDPGFADARDNLAAVKARMDQMVPK